MKKPYLSKTLIANAITAVSMLIPGVGEWVASHATLVVVGLAGLNTILRLVTKEKIGLED